MKSFRKQPLWAILPSGLAVGDVGELAGGAPAADDAVGGAGADGAKTDRIREIRTLSVSVFSN
jgi:hypothetical protein